MVSTPLLLRNPPNHSHIYFFRCRILHCLFSWRCGLQFTSLVSLPVRSTERSMTRIHLLCILVLGIPKNVLTVALSLRRSAWCIMGRGTMARRIIQQHHCLLPLRLSVQCHLLFIPCRNLLWICVPPGTAAYVFGFQSPWGTTPYNTTLVFELDGLLNGSYAYPLTSSERRYIYGVKLYAVEGLALQSYTIKMILFGRSFVLLDYIIYAAESSGSSSSSSHQSSGYGDIYESVPCESLLTTYWDRNHPKTGLIVGIVLGSIGLFIIIAGAITMNFFRHGIWHIGPPPVMQMAE